MLVGASQSMRIVYLTQVWPEPRSSAAGLRSWNVIRALRSNELVVASAATNEPARLELEQAGVQTQAVSLNRSCFDDWIQSFDPTVVIFDRFLLEEQFGARVAAKCPNAARILDTIDLHFLRRARQSGATDWRTEDAYRELASIFRCDHTWVVSDFEYRLLSQEAQVPSELLSVSRLSPDRAGATALPHESRQHFASIGNFRHPPNLDSARWLKREVWPLVRRALPGAELHLFGAYPSREVMEMNQPGEGFFVDGPAPHAVSTLGRFRVTLAPLRFGAGIKGKILDGWSAGTPVVTTPVGSEGMSAEWPFPGLVAGSAQQIAEEAVRLHEDQTLWSRVQGAGYELLDRLYGADVIEKGIAQQVELTVRNLPALRAQNLVGRILELATTRSTLYFSRWIEAKEKLIALNASLAAESHGGLGSHSSEAHSGETSFAKSPVTVVDSQPQ
jgi:glycosyltransferase involved in cell wall biosynthesis